MYLRADCVQEARVQTLKEELNALKMKSSESIEDYPINIGSLVSKIRELGETMEDSYVIKRMLRALSNKFLQLVTSIEQFADLKVMPVEELIGHLKAHEEHLHVADGGDDEHLLLTQAQWRAKEEKSGGKASSSSAKRGCSRGRGRDRGHSDGEHSSDNKFDIRKVRCYNCQNYEDYSWDCRKQKKQGKAFVA